MEFHPKINRNNPIIKESKIILGSFPTWTLTEPDLKKKETLLEKENERTKNGDLLFFYGSSINRFWLWYQKFVDQDVSKNDISSIEKSLKNKSIGITDVIISCERKNISALDKYLTKRTYNHQFFQIPKSGETVKILCTSKGVMNEMLLNNVFFKLHPELNIDSTKSFVFQNEIIKPIHVDLSLVRKPFCRVVEVESGGTIECIALPSPGSPYRKLIDFGYASGSADDFLNNYLKEVFDWFVK